MKAKANNQACETMEQKVKKARESNPGLHMLYVKNACTHLLAINKAIADLGAFSNLNLMDSQTALVKERDKLIETEPAYYEADELLYGVMSHLKKNLRYETHYELRQRTIDESVGD